MSKKKLRKRVRKLERQVARLKQRPALPAIAVPTIDLDPHALWDAHVTDYAAGYTDDEDWDGYL